MPNRLGQVRSYAVTARDSLRVCGRGSLASRDLKGQWVAVGVRRNEGWEFGWGRGDVNAQARRQVSDE